MGREPFKVKVEYECNPVRNIAIECPKCKKWFRKLDVTNDDIYYAYQIINASYKCPICGEEFNATDNALCIVECFDGKEVYKDCVEKVVLWK